MMKTSREVKAMVSNTRLPNVMLALSCLLATAGSVHAQRPNIYLPAGGSFIGKDVTIGAGKDIGPCCSIRQ